MPPILTANRAIIDGQKIDLRPVIPLRPFIFGPRAGLHRYAVADEKDNTLLGDYNYSADTVFSWPNREDDASIIDLDYDKLAVTFEDIRLLYYSDPIGGTYDILPDADYSNRIGGGDLTFASFTAPDDTDYPHTSVFGDRGVKVGDVLTISGTVSSVPYSLTTTVQGFVNTMSAASVGSAAENANNDNTQSASASVSQIAGTPVNHVDTAASAASYDGVVDGYISDTYIITCTTGGIAANALLDIQSSSGLDDDTDVTPAAFASPTSIGARGGTVTFSLDSGRTVDSGVEADEFVAGQKWTVTFNGAFTSSVPTSGGTYTGDEDLDYIITVTRGGTFPVTLVDPPSGAPTVSATGGGVSGGSLQAGAYYCKYTWVNSNGETTASPESTQFTISAGNIPEVTIASLPTGATSANIYLTVAGGATNTETRYQQFVTTTTTDLEDATTTGNPVPPSTNTCTVDSGDPAPQITVTTVTGADASGPTNVKQTATAYAVGSLGVTIAFSLTQLSKGDVYTIAATAPAPEGYDTLVLNNDLGALQDATDLAVKFYIPVDSQNIDEFSSESPFDPYWEADQDGVTLKAGVVLFHDEWTVDDEPVALPVDSASAYVTYREWLTTGQGTIGTIDSREDVESALGLVDPDNPIASAVDWALQNNANSLGVTSRTAQNARTNEVRYSVLAGDGDPTVEDNWTSTLDLVSGEMGDGVYNLVPLTTNEDVHLAVANHVTAESDDSVGNYRVVFLPASIETSVVIVDQNNSDDEEIVLATISQDPATTSTEFTYLQVPAGNASFITNGVQAGDKVRYAFSVDSDGNPTYDTYVVEDVVSENTLRLVSGPDAAVASAIKTEVHRDVSKDDLVDQLVAKAAAYANERVRLVWPDIVGADGLTYPGYNLNAAIAGIAGSVPSHQGLSKVEVVGPDNHLRAGFFTNEQLNTLSINGVWVVDVNENGRFYTRRAVTTDPSTVNSFEEMAVRNTDATRYAYLGRWERLYGNTNVTPSALRLMTADFDAITSLLLSSTRIDRLGPMILDAKLTSLAQHSTLEDRVSAQITATLPIPMNKAELTIII